MTADVLVTGATGLIGRWLVPALTRRGHEVAVLLRDSDLWTATRNLSYPAASLGPTQPGGGGSRGGGDGSRGGGDGSRGGGDGSRGRGHITRADELRAWTLQHGGDPAALTFVPGDVERDDLGGHVNTLTDVRDVYHLAARFQFGLTEAEARQANVDGSLNVLRWAGTRPHLRRFVMVGGYRTAAKAWRAMATRGWPLEDRDRAALYAGHGAYEASKMESDLAVHTIAAQLKIPLTTVHPASVIGDSRTGESLPQPGLTEAVRDLWRGRMAGVVSDPDIVAPVVAVDHLAEFLAAVPEHPESIGGDYLLMHPDSPSFADLVDRLAGLLGVPAPRARLPLRVVRRLPARLSGVDREALAFLSSENYDGTAADAFATSIGLTPPDLTGNLARWTDHLVATGFGERPAGEARRAEIAGVRTYLLGDLAKPELLLLHGLPLDADSWDPVAERLGATLRPDLPGLGRSSTPTRVTVDTMTTWAGELLAPIPNRPVIAGHSLGAGVALRLAAQQPEKVRELVLVSPYFLQRPVPRPLRQPWVATAVLRRRKAPALRPGVARRMAELLAEISTPDHRRRMAELLASCPVPVHLVVGSDDPLVTPPPAGTRVTVIDGAGHDPHLTRPREVAELLASAPV